VAPPQTGDTGGTLCVVTRPDAYLDAASAAPLRPAAQEALAAAVQEGWADPRRLHREGRQARLLLDGAREAVAAVLRVRTEEVTFTAGHEDAVGAAVHGVRHARRRAGSAVVTSAVEHSAVLHAARREDHLTAPVDRDGVLDVPRFAAALDSPGVVLACVQSANGEVGTLQPLAAAHAAARAAGVPLLVDAAASLGHVPAPTGWDLLAADPRAWGSPGGIGVLAVRTGVRWSPSGPAGEGTEPTGATPWVPLALAAAVGLQDAVTAMDAEAGRRRTLLDRIVAAARGVPDVDVIAPDVDRLPHVLTFSCLYVDGEALVDEFARAGFSIGSGSACTASTLEPSHVLAAMGALTHGNVRIGLPAGVSPDAVDRFCAVLPGAVARVRALLGADDL
jgi:cysteine desulfurase